MLNNLKPVAAKAAVFLLCLGAGSPASAALVNCSTQFTANPDTFFVYGGTDSSQNAASGCQYIHPPDNSTIANEYYVNGAGFFGVDTWEVATGGEKVDVNGAGLSGAWSIVDPDFTLYTYMLTFKDGRGTNLISFLLNGLYSSGGWLTPFTAPPFNLPGGSTMHGVSHYTLFRTTAEVPPPPPPDDPPGVPEPAMLTLLAAGLSGIAMRLRRRK